jgi:hypothetical protein
MLRKLNALPQGALSLLMVSLCLLSQWVAAETFLVLPIQAKPRHLTVDNSSLEVRRFVERILITQNHQNLPFVVLDKTHARVFVFDARGQLHGAAPALIGYTVGDDAVPGIGDRSLASMTREEKTTPAGRYVSSLDLNLAGNQILWVDYESAISLHSLVTNSPEEKRAERLASRSIDDNRISYGCINVSAAFFQKVVIPVFKDTFGIVYILPDSHAIKEVFSFYEP